MKLQSFDAGPHLRIVLEPQSEGLYVLVYKHGDQDGSCAYDYLQDNFEMAKLFCHDEYGTAYDSWHEYSGPDVMA